MEADTLPGCTPFSRLPQCATYSMRRQRHAGRHILGHARMLIPHPAGHPQRTGQDGRAHPAEATGEAPSGHAIEDTANAAGTRQRRVPCHQRGRPPSPD